MVIRLRRKEIREYYETPGHLFAQIKCCADGSVFLIVKDETGKVWEIPADGVFLAVGLQPENDAFAPLAQLDDRGYFDTDEFCVTKTAGLFVAGDCRRKQIRQVTTAAADGAVAAMAACRYLEQ